MDCAKHKEPQGSGPGPGRPDGWSGASGLLLQPGKSHLAEELVLRGIGPVGLVGIVRPRADLTGDPKFTCVKPVMRTFPLWNSARKWNAAPKDLT